MDDIVDTANTLCKAATALKEHGAKKVIAYCTHPVLSGDAVERIAASDMDEIVVTDTIPPWRLHHPGVTGRLRVVSTVPLVAEAIRTMHAGGSLSALAAAHG
jgi:ribose-phosphate pyrophosphokinase